MHGTWIKTSSSRTAPTHSRTLRGWLAGWPSPSPSPSQPTHRSIDTASTAQHSLHRMSFPPSAVPVLPICASLMLIGLSVLAIPSSSAPERDRQQQKKISRCRAALPIGFYSQIICPPPWPRYTCHIRARRRNVSDVVGYPASHFWQGNLLGACSLSRGRPKKRRRSRRRNIAEKQKLCS